MCVSVLLCGTVTSPELVLPCELWSTVTLIFTFSDALMLHPDFYATLVCALVPSEGRKVDSFRHLSQGDSGAATGQSHEQQVMGSRGADWI